jgi:hypothetical protein
MIELLLGVNLELGQQCPCIAPLRTRE